ncbi:MAG: hypothetical protein SFZ02_17925 [bacterium]|nr:hypothetical protein [bacterium]
MLSHQHWSRNFSVEPDDTDTIINLLLEEETPMTSQELARRVVAYRLEKEAALLQEKYKDTAVYNPASAWSMGQKLVFPALEHATGRVIDIREGENPEYGEFRVIQVEFDDKSRREFACDYKLPHKLTAFAETTGNPIGTDVLTLDDIMAESGNVITQRLEQALIDNDTLVSVAKLWFPRDLILPVDIGSLHLAEAVLDMNGGGPMPTEEILEQMGGIGDSPMSLQVLSLNYALNQDARFDEVGPAGKVLWYLSRMEPAEVKEAPPYLRYTPIEYDLRLISPQMANYEAEIGDELSNLTPSATPTGTITLIYPHRRAGTLPITVHNQHIFPTAHTTTRIWITLVDMADGEEFVGWVVPSQKYVLGFAPLYEKYHLPIGSKITVKKGKTPERFEVDAHIHKARTEWVPVFDLQGDSAHFENIKRPIEADYDQLMLIGVDQLAQLDQLVKNAQTGKKSLTGILKMLLPPLGKLSPQGAAHIKTVYSAVNLLRRCPPGPIMATLEANPDFTSFGGEYWKLLDDTV